MRNVEIVDMEQDDKISAHVDFDTASQKLEYTSSEFEIKENIPAKKEQIKIEHVTLGRNSTSGSSGLF